MEKNSQLIKDAVIMLSLILAGNSVEHKDHFWIKRHKVRELTQKSVEKSLWYSL